MLPEGSSQNGDWVPFEFMLGGFSGSPEGNKMKWGKKSSQWSWKTKQKKKLSHFIQMGTSEVDIPYAHAPPRLFILPCLAQNIDFPQSAVCADLIHRLFIFSLLALHFRANTTCSGTFFFFFNGNATSHPVSWQNYQLSSLASWTTSPFWNLCYTSKLLWHFKSVHLLPSLAASLLQDYGHTLPVDILIERLVTNAVKSFLSLVKIIC